MKKIILFLGLVVIAGSLMAAQPKFLIPSDVNNVKDVGSQWSGVETVKLVTSTTPALVVDANSVTISDGFIHWIILASTDVAAGHFLEMRATGIANVTSARLIPRLYQQDISTGNANNPFIIKPPIPFSNGLSVNLGPAATAPDSYTEFAIGVGWKQR